MGGAERDSRALLDARHLRGRLQQPAFRRRVHPPRAVPQPVRPLRPRMARRQQPLGLDRRGARRLRPAPGRHRVARGGRATHLPPERLGASQRHRPRRRARRLGRRAGDHRAGAAVEGEAAAALQLRLDAARQTHRAGPVAAARRAHLPAHVPAVPERPPRHGAGAVGGAASALRGRHRGGGFGARRAAPHRRAGRRAQGRALWRGCGGTPAAEGSAPESLPVSRPVGDAATARRETVGAQPGTG